MEQSDDNYVFAEGDRVEFKGFAHPFKGTVLGPVPKLGITYYVRSSEGEVRMFQGKALERL